MFKEGGITVDLRILAPDNTSNHALRQILYYSYLRLLEKLDAKWKEK